MEIWNVKVDDMISSKRVQRVTPNREERNVSICIYKQKKGTISLQHIKSKNIITGTYKKLAIILGVEEQVIYDLIFNKIKRPELKDYKKM